MVPSPASEEDWARRLMHRIAGVEAIRRTKEYLAMELMLESDQYLGYLERADPDRLSALKCLRSPSPTDWSLSHRAWEKAMQVWRSQLRKLTKFSL